MLSYENDPSKLPDPLIAGRGIAGRGLAKAYLPGLDAFILNVYSAGPIIVCTSFAIPITSFLILLAGFVNARALIFVLMLSTFFAISFI